MVAFLGVGATLSAQTRHAAVVARTRALRHLLRTYARSRGGMNAARKSFGRSFGPASTARLLSAVYYIVPFNFERAFFSGVSHHCRWVRTNVQPPSFRELVYGKHTHTHTQRLPKLLLPPSGMQFGIPATAPAALAREACVLCVLLRRF